MGPYVCILERKKKRPPFKPKWRPLPIQLLGLNRAFGIKLSFGISRAVLIGVVPLCVQQFRVFATQAMTRERSSIYASKHTRTFVVGPKCHMYTCFLTVNWESSTQLSSKSALTSVSTKHLSCSSKMQPFFQISSYIGYLEQCWLGRILL